MSEEALLSVWTSFDLQTQSFSSLPVTIRFLINFLNKMAIYTVLLLGDNL